MATSTGFTFSTSISKRNTTTFCTAGTRVSSKGIFFGESPIRFSLPLVLFQLGLVNSLTAAFELLLKPFGQPIFVSQLLGGMAMGQSFLGRTENFKNAVYTQQSAMLLDIYELLGFTLYTFMMGVKIDLSSVRKSKRIAFVIGFTSFTLPLLCTGFLAHYLTPIVKWDDILRQAISIVAFLQSMTSFHMTSSMLADLKLQNSEMGRLALDASKISGILSWMFLILSTSLKLSSNAIPAFTNLVSRLILVLIVYLFFRPIMFYMIEQTPEGRPLKESYVFAITLMVLSAALFGDICGFHSIFGAAMVGLAVPVGPPLGSGLVYRLECFISAILLPFYLINVGRNIDVFDLDMPSFGIVESIVLMASLCKIVGTIVPSMCNNMPFIDALSLGLLLSCQGFFDIQFFSWSLSLKMIEKKSFSIMVLMAMLHSAAFIPLVGYLYDPSSRYLASRKHTIQQSRYGTEFRILVCVYEEENVSSLLNILELSNPARQTPIAVYAIELVKLMGMSSPTLITHRKNPTIPTNRNPKSNPIVKAFHQYGNQKGGMISVQCFTAISTYESMHDDICSIALEKSTSLIIIPFRKTNNLFMRALNKAVLSKAPCSVAILVDRGKLKESSHLSLACWIVFRVCVVFIGGGDDREALAYGSRMAQSLNVSINLVRILSPDRSVSGLEEEKLDAMGLMEIRTAMMGNKQATYEEECAKDSADLVRVIRGLDRGYDMIVAGRRHDSRLPVVWGLSEWSEVEELGVIGDILASKDFKSDASVLVVQQQVTVGGFLNPIDGLS